MSTAPALFVSHGAPTFALEPGRLGPALAALGRSLAPLSAVLVVSPHWQSRDVRVMTGAQPATLHDFGGFPAALYELQYPAPGAPALAAQAAALLRAAGFDVGLDDQRGLDHGAWVPLRHLFPRAQVPVFQVAMPYDLDVDGALRLGQALAPLREHGVMIVGSGSLTHNLHEFRGQAGPPAPYVRAFSAWIRDAVARRDAQDLLHYRERAPFAARAHPTEDHYLPLLTAFGASTATDALRVLEGGVTYSVLSMDSCAWGAPP